MRRQTGNFFLTTMAMLTLTSPGEVQPGFAPQNPSGFIGIADFSKFTRDAMGHELVLTSLEIPVPIAWDELVVSWNAKTPSGTYLKIAARGIYPNHTTKFYTLGLWSEDVSKQPRESVSQQKDSDGNVSTDTLILSKPGARAQIRVTLGCAEENIHPELKFLGLSFLDSKSERVSFPSNESAWGKIIETPERSQNSYPEEQGWCSPTSLAMVLMRWSEVLQRPELNLDVRECAAGVLDKNYGTGNWPFNTAFAGKFEGMRAYITRFSGLSELEDWIAAGTGQTATLRNRATGEKLVQILEATQMVEVFVQRIVNLAQVDVSVFFVL